MVEDHERRNDENEDVSESFDPNYDPAFQRGYTPRPGEAHRTRLRNAADDSPFRRPPPGREAAGPTASAATPASPYQEPAGHGDLLDADRFDRTPESDAEPFRSDAGSDALPSDDRAGSAVVITGASILDRAEISPKRNPYFLALWIIGGGFVVLGIVLYAFSIYTSYTGTTDSQDVSTLVFSQVGWMLAGPLVTVGLATIVALILLTALRTRARRTPRADASAEHEGSQRAV